MFYSLNGNVIHTEPGFVVIECGGVGFKCVTTATTIRTLPARGGVASVFTHLNVREDALDLFGFSTMEELGCFKLLISINGVGPKAAISILSDMNPERFAICVATGDAKALTSAPGIGAKIAQRIILELKDKLAAGIGGNTEAAIEGAVPVGSNASEAVAAMVALGFSQSEASVAVARIDPSLPVESIIKSALRAMAEK